MRLIKNSQDWDIFLEELDDDYLTASSKPKKYPCIVQLVGTGGGTAGQYQKVEFLYEDKIRDLYKLFEQAYICVLKEAHDAQSTSK